MGDVVDATVPPDVGEDEVIQGEPPGVDDNPRGDLIQDSMTVSESNLDSGTIDPKIDEKSETPVAAEPLTQLSPLPAPDVMDAAPEDSPEDCAGAQLNELQGTENSTIDAAADAVQSSNEIVIVPPTDIVKEVVKDSPTAAPVPQLASPGSQQRPMQMLQMFTRRLLSPLSDPKPETNADLEEEKKRQMEMLREQLQQMDAGLVETLDTQQGIQEKLVEQARSETHEHESLPIDQSDLILKDDSEPTPMPPSHDDNARDPATMESKQDEGGLESFEKQAVASDETISSESHAPKGSRIEGQEQSAAIQDALPGRESVEGVPQHGRVETDPIPFSETIDMKMKEATTDELSTTSVDKEGSVSVDFVAEVDETVDGVPTKTEPEKGAKAIDGDEILESAGELLATEEEQQASDAVLSNKVEETLESPDIESELPTLEEDSPVSNTIPTENVVQVLESVPTNTESEVLDKAMERDENVEIEGEIPTSEGEQPKTGDVLVDKVGETLDSVPTNTEPGTVDEAVEMKENPDIASEHPSCEEETPASDTLALDNVAETLKSLPANTEPEGLAEAVDANQNLEIASDLSTGEHQQPASGEVLERIVDENLDGVSTNTEPGTVVEVVEMKENPEIVSKPPTSEDEMPLSDTITKTNVEDTLAEEPSTLAEESNTNKNEVVMVPLCDDSPVGSVDETLESVPTSTEPEALDKAIDVKENPTIESELPISEENVSTSDGIESSEINETNDSVPTTTGPETLTEAVATNENSEDVVTQFTGGEPAKLVEAIDANKIETVPAEPSILEEDQPLSKDTSVGKVAETLEIVPASTEPDALDKPNDVMENPEIESEIPITEEELPTSDEIASGEIKETNNSVPTAAETLDETIDTPELPENVGAQSTGEHEPLALAEAIDTSKNEDVAAGLSPSDQEQPSSEVTLVEKLDESFDSVPASTEPETLDNANDVTENPEIGSELPRSEERLPTSDEIASVEVNETNVIASNHRELETLAEVVGTSENSEDVGALSTSEGEPSTLADAVDTSKNEDAAAELSTGDQELPSTDDSLVDKVDERLDSIQASAVPGSSDKANAMTDTAEIESEVRTSEEKLPTSADIAPDNVNHALDTFPTNIAPEALAQVSDANENPEIANALSIGDVQVPASDDVLVEKVEETHESVPTSSVPGTLIESIDMENLEIANEHPTSEGEAPPSDASTGENVHETLESVPTNTESEASAEVTSTNENPEIASTLSSGKVPELTSDVDKVDETLEGIPSSTEPEALEKANDVTENPEIARDLPESLEKLPTSDAIVSDEVSLPTTMAEPIDTQEIPENKGALSTGEENRSTLTEGTDTNKHEDAIPELSTGDEEHPSSDDTQTGNVDASLVEGSKEGGNDNDGRLPTSNDEIHGVPSGEGVDATLGQIHPLQTLKRLSVLVLPSPIPPRHESIEAEKLKQSVLIRAKLKELDLEDLEIEIEQQQHAQTQLVHQAMESSMTRLVHGSDDNGEHAGQGEQATLSHNRSSTVLGHVTDWLSSSLHHRDDVKSPSGSRGKVDAGDISKKPHGFLSAVGEFLSGSSQHRDIETPASTIATDVHTVGPNQGPSSTATKQAATGTPSLKDKIKVLLDECDDNQALRERILELVQADASNVAKKSETLLYYHQRSLLDKIQSPLALTTIPKNTQTLREALNKSRASRDYSPHGKIQKEHWSIDDSVESKAAARAARRSRAMAKLQRLDALIEEAQKRTWIDT